MHAVPLSRVMSCTFTARCKVESSEFMGLRVLGFRVLGRRAYIECRV